MEAEIKKETDKGFGVTVHDNNSVKHKIGVLYDGEIHGHLQDGYPDDPHERTSEGNEHVNQARKFAKWHVYRERGYDTVPPTENPDRIAAAMLAISQLPEAGVEDLFDDLFTQLRTHVTGGDVDLPFEDADPTDIIIYRKDIYLTPDPTNFDPPLVEQFCSYVDNPIATFEKIFSEDQDPRSQVPDFDIEAVSDLHYLHSTGVDEQTHRSDSPIDREPDARIELTPVDPDVFDSMRLFLISNLGNQVRDCYLMMGLEPPKVFQQQGFGSYHGMIKQQLYEMYPKHFLAGNSGGPWADNTKQL